MTAVVELAREVPAQRVIELVGPKGYIHGWIYVGPPGVGVEIRSPRHGKGRITARSKDKISVQYGNGRTEDYELKPPRKNKGKGKAGAAPTRGQSEGTRSRPEASSGYQRTPENTPKPKPDVDATGTTVAARDASTLANRIVRGDTDLASLSDAELKAVDAEFFRRAKLIGKLGVVSGDHRRVREELGNRAVRAARERTRQRRSEGGKKAAATRKRRAEQGLPPKNRHGNAAPPGGWTDADLIDPAQRPTLKTRPRLEAEQAAQRKQQRARETSDPTLRAIDRRERDLKVMTEDERRVYDRAVAKSRQLLYTKSHPIGMRAVREHRAANPLTEQQRAQQFQVDAERKKARKAEWSALNRHERELYARQEFKHQNEVDKHEAGMAAVRRSRESDALTREQRSVYGRVYAAAVRRDGVEKHDPEQAHREAMQAAHRYPEQQKRKRRDELAGQPATTLRKLAESSNPDTAEAARAELAHREQIKRASGAEAVKRDRQARAKRRNELNRIRTDRRMQAAYDRASAGIPDEDAAHKAGMKAVDELHRSRERNRFVGDLDPYERAAYDRATANSDGKTPQQRHEAGKTAVYQHRERQRQQRSRDAEQQRRDKLDRLVAERGGEVGRARTGRRITADGDLRLEETANPHRELVKDANGRTIGLVEGMVNDTRRGSKGPRVARPDETPEFYRAVTPGRNPRGKVGGNDWLGVNTKRVDSRQAAVEQVANRAPKIAKETAADLQGGLFEAPPSTRRQGKAPTMGEGEPGGPITFEGGRTGTVWAEAPGGGKWVIPDQRQPGEAHAIYVDSRGRVRDDLSSQDYQRDWLRKKRAQVEANTPRALAAARRAEQRLQSRVESMRDGAGFTAGDRPLRDLTDEELDVIQLRWPHLQVPWAVSGTASARTSRRSVAEIVRAERAWRRSAA